MASRLASAHSAYLRSAAHQPVEWYPWGPEPFERARAEHKPILLDIGAVWCHWCHVMDGESYENPAIGAALNRDWICIKVDRDERPDVDARYQRAVQALTGQGGWPLTAFLRPDGDVFFGGTYFPPRGAHGRPGLPQVLDELSRIFRDQPERVASQAQEIRRHIEAHAAETAPGDLHPSRLTDAASALAGAFDIRYGGFGSQPKFPHPGACEFLLGRWLDTRESWLREMVDRTLVAMARGGMYDQLAGGFHRYSVDARWIVPHFEKMSYDNSELLKTYVHAAQVAAGESPVPTPGGAPAGSLADPVPVAEYRRVIEGTVEWIMTVLAQPGGGYGASQDADVGPGDDGDYFTWTPQEVRAAVSPEEFTVLARHYDIADAGEMHHNPAKNVLWIRQGLAEIAAATGCTTDQVAGLLAGGRRKLLAARATRRAPYVDASVYVGWNAMMATALLDAGAYLNRPDVEQHAIQTLELLFREAAERNGMEGVRHTARADSALLLEDHVCVANAAIDAFEAIGERHWLDRALNVARFLWTEFAAPDGSLYDLPRHAAGPGFLAQRLKPVQDAPTPSGNGMAGILAARLAAHTGEADWRDRATRLVAAFAGGLPGLALYAATLLRALDWCVHPAAHVVVVGAGDDAATRELVLAARRTYRPRRVITTLRPGDSTDRLPQAVRAMVAGNEPKAYFCAGGVCAPPTADPVQLASLLSHFSLGPA